jgi:hypothetical protein
MTPSRCYNRSGFVKNASLIRGGVVDFPNSDDNIRWRLGLGVQPLDGCGPNRDASEQC